MAKIASLTHNQQDCSLYVHTYLRPCVKVDIRVAVIRKSQDNRQLSEY